MRLVGLGVGESADRLERDGAQPARRCLRWKRLSRIGWQDSAFTRRLLNGREVKITRGAVQTHQQIRQRNATMQSTIPTRARARL